MKIINRGKLAMLSISFMIMIAGYINYKYDPKREESLGQTVRVNSNEVYVFNNKENVDVYEEALSSASKNDTIYSTKTEKSSLGTYITSRANMFSELEENYTAVISNSLSKDEVQMYQEKLEKLVKDKHLLEVVEGILKAKGITDVVIVPNEDKYTVVVSLEEKLTKAQAVLIEQIIGEEFGIETAKIKIIEQ